MQYVGSSNISSSKKSNLLSNENLTISTLEIENKNKNKEDIPVYSQPKENKLLLRSFPLLYLIFFLSAVLLATFLLINFLLGPEKAVLAFLSQGNIQVRFLVLSSFFDVFYLHHNNFLVFFEAP